MTAGASFGEMALEKEDMVKRTATIVADTELELLHISKTDYRKILSNFLFLVLTLPEKHIRIEQDRKISFFLQFRFFHKWSYSEMDQFLRQYVTIKRCQLQDKIYQAGDISKSIYFIKSGRVQVPHPP
jgi:CRP-like cAMP-binding protein